MAENTEDSQPKDSVERDHELPENQVEEQTSKGAQTSQTENKKGGKRMRRSFFEEVPIDQYSNLSIKVTELTRFVQLQRHRYVKLFIQIKRSS